VFIYLTYSEFNAKKKSYASVKYVNHTPARM